jgi:hypothetical protein
MSEYSIGASSPDNTPVLPDSHIKRCEKYCEEELGRFDSYLIWLYTTGSSILAKALIGIDVKVHLILLAKRVVNRWPVFDQEEVPVQFRCDLWKDPSKFADLPNGVKVQMGKDIYRYYLERFTDIMRNAPALEQDLTVYRVTTPYDELLEADDDVNHYLFQRPFSSTTVNREMVQFCIFLGGCTPNVTCCAMEVTIPKGAPLLIIPNSLHAYPYQYEAVLPFGTVLDIREITKCTVYDPEVEMVPIPGRDFEKRKKWALGPLFYAEVSFPAKESEVNYYITRAIFPETQCVTREGAALPDSLENNNMSHSECRSKKGMFLEFGKNAASVSEVAKTSTKSFIALPAKRKSTTSKSSTSDKGVSKRKH